RWAARRGVPVVACDLPLADRGWREGERVAQGPGRLSDALRSRLTGRPGDDLWDRLVEAVAPGSTPEALRRAALLTGWALREESTVSEVDLRREEWMRSRLAEATTNGARAAVVVGAFHTPALSRPFRGAGNCAPSPPPTPPPIITHPQPQHQTPPQASD
ncbi:DUF5682 family protein, partial [Streptomyces sp. NPDC059627]